MARTANTQVHVVSADIARRMLLHAQGLLDDPSRPATPARLLKLITRMGFVQLDTINVVERAHHLTLAARMDGYRPAMLAPLCERTRVLFEHWTHDASVIPTEWFHHWRPRFERYRKRLLENRWWMERIGDNHEDLLEAVRSRIRQAGPLQSRDFEHRPAAGEAAVGGGWWGWKPQKAALEHLWRIGELAIVKRINFQKVYDLTERVLPAASARPAPDEHEHVDWACRSALERLGTATPGEIAAFWHAISIGQARAWCQSAVRGGDIVEVVVESADGSKSRRAFAFAHWRDSARKVPEANGRLRLLSPFDPVLRDRKRTLRLFNFDYTFEAFVPSPKRRFGYYIMPIMERDRLVGRVDPKFHRDRGELSIKRVWWEPGVKPTRARRVGLVAAAERLAAFIGADRMTIESSSRQE